MQKIFLLDTETTGVEVADKVCQLSYVLLDNNQYAIYDDLCNPQVELNFSAMCINHITPEMVQDKPILAQTNSFITLQQHNTQANVIVAHNAKFDLQMLAKDGFTCQMQIIDTLRCMKHLFKDGSSYSLQYLRYSLGLYKLENTFGEEIVAHSARGDVLILKLLFDFLLQNTSVAELIRLTQTPIFYEKFPFGKYKGQMIVDILSSDFGYCSYLLQGKIDDKDLIASIEHYVKDLGGNITHRFTVGKYKGKSASEIDDLGYLKWAHENMTTISSGLKEDIAEKIKNTVSANSLF